MSCSKVPQPGATPLSRRGKDAFVPVVLGVFPVDERHSPMKVSTVPITKGDVAVETDDSTIRGLN